METITKLSPGIPLAVSSRPVVLCVDDDPAILRSFERLLRHEPYDLRTFEDPVQALAWLERTDVDVVLSDQRMPTMAGTEFLDEVHRRSPGTSCALITASPESEAVAQIAGGRIQRVLAKPWDGMNLKGAILDLLGARVREVKR